MSESPNPSLIKQFKSWIARLEPGSLNNLVAGLKAVDANKDGTVSFDELAQAEARFTQRENLAKEVNKVHTAYSACTAAENAKNHSIIKEEIGDFDLSKMIQEKKPEAYDLFAKIEAKARSLRTASEKKCADVRNSTIASITSDGDKLDEVWRASEKLDNVGLSMRHKDFGAVGIYSINEVRDVVGLAQRRAMDRVANEAGALVHVPMAGKIIESKLAPEIKELNAVLKEYGAPVVADDFVDKAVDSAKKRPKKPDIDARQRPPR